MTAGLDAIFAAAVAACDPRAAVRAALAGAGVGDRVRLIAIGKAAVAMAAGAVDALGAAIVDGLVVHPDGVAVPSAIAALDVRAAAHPTPDPRSEAAGRAALALAARVEADEVLLALISGGASALAAVPKDGLSLRDKAAAIAALARSGAPIAALAAARQARSAIKGGRLAAASRGRVVTLVASDVPGDDVAVVGSGPTVPLRAGDAIAVIAGLGRLRAEAAAAARAAGWTVEILDDDLVGDVGAVADRALAAAARLASGALWIAGGEWTVALDGAAGEGGRASELALVLARALCGQPDLIALVGASDGVDGTGPGAGAIVDGATWDAIADPDAALAGHDSGRALAAVGAALVTGPTGINHADLVMIGRATGRR